MLKSAVVITLYPRRTQNFAGRLALNGLRDGTIKERQPGRRQIN